MGLNLKQTLSLYAETPQRDNASMTGKPYQLVDQQSWGYGHVISEHDTYPEAYEAMLARPGSKVIMHGQPNQTQENRDKAFQHSQETNPDLDAESAASVSPQSSLFPRGDSNDTPEVRDKIRHRQVKTNPLVD